jgi:hypothetical protein
VKTPKRWRLGYLGTYSDDRQPGWIGCYAPLPGRCRTRPSWWPARNIRKQSNGRQMSSTRPSAPCRALPFYCAQDFTLNVTREDMKSAGYSPSVRLFEAAACGVPIISDRWDGLDTFFALGSEILVADTSEDALRFLTKVSEAERRAIGGAARARILARHTSDHRAAELEQTAFDNGSNKPAKPDRACARFVLRGSPNRSMLQTFSFRVSPHATRQRFETSGENRSRPKEIAVDHVGQAWERALAKLGRGAEADAGQALLRVFLTISAVWLVFWAVIGGVFFTIAARGLV